MATVTASVKNQVRHPALAVCHTLMQRNPNGGNKGEIQQGDETMRSPVITSNTLGGAEVSALTFSV